VDPAHRRGARFGIGGELRRIHVHEVHHEARGTGIGHELRHLPGKGEDRADPPRTQHPRHEGAQAGRVEQGQRDRLAGGERGKAGGGASPAADLDMRPAERVAQRRAQRRQMRGVVLVVGEAGEMDAREPRQVPQHVPRADLVAAIRRKGDTVGEEQDVTHQPSPRASVGPSALASHSGSRRHSAIRNR
jgi:hypothetical protein